MRSYSLSSGPLLSLLSAALLFGSGANRISAGQQNRVKAPSQAKSGAKQIALLSGKRQDAKKPPEPPVKTQIGDITISGAQTTEGVLGSREFHLKGPNTEIDVPDKASKSVLHVHADDIRASRVGKNDLGLITLDGNVRYRLVQQTPEGERILEGSSGHAVLRRTTQHLDFTRGVRAKLADPARFSTPATLRTDTLNVAMDAKRYRFNLEGASATNDIRFTPLQPPAAKEGEKPGAPTPVGAVHIAGFRSGELQFGQSIHLQGAGTTCDFASPDEKTSWHLEGEQFEGEFVPDTSDLQRATVTDNVKFHITQPSSDKKAQTTAEGSTPQASYVRSKDGQEMVVHGPFNTSFTDPVHLEKPATIMAEKSATLKLKKAGDSISYSIDDPQQTVKMRIFPKPFEEASAKTTTPPVPK